MSHGFPVVWPKSARTRATTCALFGAFRRLSGAVVLASLSLLGGAMEISALAFVFGWSVISVDLYRSTTVFVPEIAASRGFRALFSLFALAQAIALTEVTTVGEPIQRAIYFFALAVASVVCFVGYLRFVAGWDFFDFDGPAVELLDKFGSSMDARAELETDRSFEEPVRTVALSVWVTAVGVVLAVPCVIAGFAAALLSNAFPLPEILLLALVAAESDFLPRSEKSVTWLALDRRMYVALSSATRNLKGATLITLSTVGGLTAAGLFAVAVSFVLDFVVIVRVAVPLSPLVAWNFFGILLLLPATTVYALWYWVRQLERVEGFLDRWSSVPTVFAGPTRPRGGTLFPTLAFVGIALFLALSTKSNQLPWLAFAVAWPGLLVSLLWSVSWTRSTPPQMPDDEDVAVVTGLFVQLSGIRIGGRMRRFVDGQWLTTVFDPVLLFALVAIVGTTYLPEVVRYRANRDGPLRYATAAYLFVFGILTGSVALTEHGQLRVLLNTFAGICVVGALAIAVAERIQG